MTPIYIENFYCDLDHSSFQEWVTSLSWEEKTSARKELFMSEPAGVSYSYGSERSKRHYVSIALDPLVHKVLDRINWFIEDEYSWGPLNGAFLNLYEGKKNALGWHADDFPGMIQTRPVAVVSFGEEREIWWREKGFKGLVPENQRQKLGWGSLFLMPPGFQETHDHKIPKGDQKMECRVSITARAFEIFT
jgi:alkylated DNA repair dioxygenase AlkB